MTFNTQVTVKLKKRSSISLDVFNILNAPAADVTYYYASWLKSDAASPAFANNPSINPALGGSGIDDYHFHPSQARTVRLRYSAGF